MKGFAVVFVFGCALGLALGYDFSDPLYNSILSEEYLDLIDGGNEVMNVRGRRELAAGATEEKKCRNKERELPSSKCCKEAIEIPEKFEKIGQYKKQCFTEMKTNKDESEVLDIFSCDRLTKKKEELRCLTQCIFNKQTLLNEDNSLNLESIKKHFKSVFNTAPWVQDNVDPIMTTCYEEALKEVQEEGQCSPQPMKFAYCMWREYAKACPAEQQKDSKACTQIRDGKLTYFHLHDHHH